MVVTAQEPVEEVCFHLSCLFATRSSPVESISINSTMPQGASSKELLLESARRNNIDLLEEVISANSSNLADLLNSTRDGVGNTAIHLAAKNGSRSFPPPPSLCRAPPPLRLVICLWVLGEQWKY